VRRVPLEWEDLPPSANQTSSFCGHLHVAASDLCWSGREYLINTQAREHGLGSAVRALAILRTARKGFNAFYCDFNTLEDYFPLGHEAVVRDESWIFLPSTVILVFGWVSLGGWKTGSSVGQCTRIYDLSRQLGSESFYDCHRGNDLRVVYYRVGTSR